MCVNCVKSPYKTSSVYKSTSVYKGAADWWQHCAGGEEQLRTFSQASTARRGCLSMDISKAFDSVSWVTIDSTLTSLGFSPMFRKLVSECYSNQTSWGGSLTVSTTHEDTAIDEGGDGGAFYQKCSKWDREDNGRWRSSYMEA